MSSSALTSATIMKANALRRAFQQGDAAIALAPNILAMLTSSTKEEREQGKRRVRELTSIGRALLYTEASAGSAADFANRYDPDEIAP